MAEKYNTNLAAEFHVLSVLHRLGADASLSLGNKKAVDITVVRSDGMAITIDVKGVAGKFDWPADNADTDRKRHFFALVSFEGKIDEPNVAPSVWIIPAEDLLPFIRVFKTRTVISRAAIRSTGGDYDAAWPLLKG